MPSACAVHFVRDGERVFGAGAVVDKGFDPAPDWYSLIG